MMELEYMKKRDKLDNLESTMEENKIIMKLLHNCSEINKELDNKNLTNKELDKIINRMKKILSNVNICKLYSEQYIENTIYIYETAYNLIKLELVYGEDSKLYQYIVDREIPLKGFNNLIKKEIDNCNIDENLRERVLDIKCDDINQSYFDLSVVKLLLFNNNDIFRNKIINQINSFSTLVDLNNFRLDYINNEIFYEKENIQKKKSDIRNNKKNYGKSLISLVIVASLFTGGVACVEKIVRDYIKGKGYKKIVVSYSLQDGYKVSNDVYFATDEEILEDKFYITYGEETENVDIASVDLNKIQDYLISKSLEGVSFNMVNYEHLDEDVELSIYVFLLICMLSAYSAIFSLLSGFGNLFGEKVSVNLYNLRNNLDKLRLSKIEYKTAKKEILENLNCMLKIINDNLELKNKFNDCVYENRYLLEDTDSLYARFNQLVDEDKIIATKKLVKEYKNC